MVVASRVAEVMTRAPIFLLLRIYRHTTSDREDIWVGGVFHSGWVGLGHGKFAKLSGFLDEELFLSCAACPFG